jgi:hypothetical protein
MSPDDQLAELWAAGATFTDMGLKLGESRNTIAGRIDRARKSGDPRFGPRPPKPKAEPPKVRIIKPAGEAVGNVRSLHPAPEPSRPRLLINLKSTDCRWPTGAAADGRHLFCGQPQAPGVHIASAIAELSALRLRPFRLRRQLESADEFAQHVGFRPLRSGRMRGQEAEFALGQTDSDDFLQHAPLYQYCKMLTMLHIAA